MDRLDELAVFVAVLDSGSLVGAARRLRRSPPSVTRALSALEVRLGARLIERTTRKLTPTEIGGRVATDARRALAAYAEAIRPGAEISPRGLLRITAPLIFGRRHVTPAVASFLDLYPAMRAELGSPTATWTCSMRAWMSRFGSGHRSSRYPHRTASARCDASLWRRHLISPRTARRANRRSLDAMRWCTWSDGRFHPNGAFVPAAARKSSGSTRG
jgi:hypothetical protein